MACKWTNMKYSSSWGIAPKSVKDTLENPRVLP
ncbi:Putative protein [Zobellia galactanivorans]|uniref:Uncharacterized protein n=1 Tax=Zobellia galactanivorans (strain DSM 12802 / CCUG 47099 / CIP 106680 / NCIMB 13871 / Dsij) TaxID=63186 RepID=G0LB12_ZOBGA|nr:Putative protein [Zobellia galactanivorans]